MAGRGNPPVECGRSRETASRGTQGNTDPMNQEAEPKARRMAPIREGLDAAKEAAGQLPDIVRKASARVRGGEDPEPEYVIVEDLPDALKVCYLSALVWLMHFDDEHVDERELCEIQVLMTQLGCGSDVRQAVRSCLEEPEGLDSGEQVARMLELLPPENAGTTLPLRCSLIKDAIRVRRATGARPAGEEPGIRRLAEILQLESEQVAFIEEACELDERILAGEVSDREIAKAAKGTAAHAAAVGVPVAAVYLSGSVAGLSAAGVTSGLATLGLGGVLGLSSMVTGIGVAILAGGAAYKGVRWVLGGSERSRASRRELMLQEVLRIHQRAIINLGEDISFFGERVASLSVETEKNRKALDRLSREVVLISRSAGALRRIGERATTFERDLEGEVSGDGSR